MASTGPPGPAQVSSTSADWQAAARELIRGLHGLASDEARLRLLEALCRRLGQQLYPAFLQILLTVQRGGDVPARQLVARTLVHGLLSGRLPSGELPAWGGSALGGDRSFGQVRLLGPIEYLCAWYGQPSNLDALSQRQFDTMLVALLELMESDADAAALYRRKLLHDADDPLDGTLSNRTRDALRALVGGWDDNRPDKAIEAFHEALRATSLLFQLARSRQEPR